MKKYQQQQQMLEVVFLSYKAAMSDSIESIYLAAKADPACDAYWIPIPYYDRKPDGTLGTMHYEGEEYYADNIECTDWQTYDIEVRHPDVIFTFNPYDGGNRMTTVHPDFYCKRLRGLTDLLVYCPYFVVVDDVPEHLAEVLACVFAHKVIVQSEKVRDTYVRVYKEQFGGVGDRFGKPEDKFIALGSPKFDKVIYSKREDFMLPDEWMKLMERPNGTRKKVILYNTTVAAILQYSEQYLKKLRSVLETFREREDVVLWWRPHPLMLAAFSGMRPELPDEYKKIVEAYRCEGFGIYDESADLHRAIAWSDGYYGDWSSLVALYEVTGKGMMLQDVKMDVPKKHDYRQLLVPASSAYDGLLCITLYDSLIVAISLVDTKNLMHSHFCNYPVYNSDFAILPFSYVTSKIGTKLYFAPRWYVQGNHFAIYDEITKTFDYIALEDKTTELLDDDENRSIKKWGSKLNDSNSPKFQNMISYGDSLFLTPSSYPAIVRVDLKTKAVFYYNDFVKELIQISKKYGNRTSYAFSMSRQLGSKIYMACRWADLLVEFDMEICKSKIILLSDRKFGNPVIQFDGENVWLFSDRYDITRWNPKTSEHRVFNHYPDEIGEAPKWQFFAILCGFIFANTVNDKQSLLKIDTNSGDITIAGELTEMISAEEHIVSLANCEEKLYLTTDKNNIYVLSDLDGAYRKADFSSSEEEKMQLYRERLRLYKNTGALFFTENVECSLDEYLDVVLGGIEACNVTGTVQGDTGRPIYEYIKNEHGN
ncbi:hypothetical protein FACS1894111_03500 [Clostridia bacterium]|nr:hypothetical protein FACS1894111_03500 [Clostridia bacterium]